MPPRATCRSQSQLEQYRQQAAELTAGLPRGAAVLEVASGPGYFAIEVARLGRFQVTGLDISRSFVQIAGENARRMGADVDLRQGDASGMPFADGSFDLIVCQAAFKTLRSPAGHSTRCTECCKKAGRRWSRT
jgi:ubiquinone/menaquinone biosynthesis C-methylase UbiE